MLVRIGTVANQQLDGKTKDRKHRIQGSQLNWQKHKCESASSGRCVFPGDSQQVEARLQHRMFSVWTDRQAKASQQNP